MKTIQIFLSVIAMMAISFTLSAQDYTGDFGWVGTDVNTSTTTVRACGVQNTIWLNSSPAVHTNASGAARFPNTTSNTSSPISITIRFSQPVCNLKLKVNDLDYGSSTSSSAAETMSTTPMFSGITASTSPPGPVFNNVGGTLTPAVGVNNTLGWVEFDGTPLTSVTLTYTRVTGYWAFLDSLTYDCCIDDCQCDDRDSKISGTTTIPSSGATSADVGISSGGVPITRLNVSLPYYESLADPDCIRCDGANISSYGKILNLPTLLGVTPSFVGPTTSGSAEIVYVFPTPTIINGETITLKLQFPPTLDLSCCPNKVNYCVKIGLIDEKCNICEKLLCVNSRVIIGTGGGTSTAPKKTNSKALLDGQSSGSSKLQLNPNPASSVLNVTLPNDLGGNLQILDLNGKRIQTVTVTSNQATLDVKSLSQGTYFVKYTSGETVITETFVKQ